MGLAGSPVTGLSCGTRIAHPIPEVTMSAVVKSWVRVFCPNCNDRQTYVLRHQWVLVCSGCGHERALRHGLLSR